MAYLRIFHRLLPELKLDSINCHVGDLGQAQYDQRQVALLAKDWNQVTPPEVHKRCMPAFLHRVSRGHAVLVLYVSTEEGLEYLNHVLLDLIGWSSIYTKNGQSCRKFCRESHLYQNLNWIWSKFVYVLLYWEKLIRKNFLLLQK